jgi:hypothetical protein
LGLGVEDNRPCLNCDRNIDCERQGSGGYIIASSSSDRGDRCKICRNCGGRGVNPQKCRRCNGKGSINEFE